MKNTVGLFPHNYPVSCHTDTVRPGGVFVAIKGMSQDGLLYIPLALEKGARVLVVAQEVTLSPELTECIDKAGATVIRVPDTRLALAQLSAEANGYPADHLHFVGVTGTKGKTTTTFLVEQMLHQAGFKTALLSTVKNRINGVDYKTKLTTQQPDYLHTFFRLCVEQGVEWVVMEVAAQAFSLSRVHGIAFDVGIFTNFSREHGEFYPTQEAYFQAKLGLLRQLKPGAPLLLNEKDKMVAALSEQYMPSFLFSDEHAYACPALVGTFNAFNVAAASLCAEKIGLTPAQIQNGLQAFCGVPGRLDRYQLPNGATAFIDYAHNPASYEAVLSELRSLTEHLIVVFGAGGDRDPVRRPLMGSIASSFADLVVVTTDNPRSEDPQEIAKQIIAGIPSEKHAALVVELDREEAIKKAYAASRSGSIIALLGKGPDEYQIVKGVTTPFSERAILLSLK